MAATGATFLERFDRDSYTEDRGLAYAMDYAGQVRDESGRLMSKSQLHAADPSWYPPPWVVINWRETIPRFRLLMDQAERVRADVLLEECLDIADDQSRQAAQARNAIDVRLRIAESFDARRFGKGPGAAGAVPDESSPDAIAGVTTEQLLAIARDGRVAVGAIEGPVAENGERAGPDPRGGEGG